MRATTAAQAQWVTINQWECQPGLTIDQAVPAYIHVSFACTNKTKAPFYVKRVEFYANGSHFPYVVDRELLPDESTDIDVAVSLSREEGLMYLQATTQVRVTGRAHIVNVLNRRQHCYFGQILNARFDGSVSLTPHDQHLRRRFRRMQFGPAAASCPRLQTA